MNLDSILKYVTLNLHIAPFIEITQYAVRNWNVVITDIIEPVFWNLEW